MAFTSKQTDYFGLSATNLILTSSDESKSATVVQAHNEKGDIVATDVCGEIMMPNCSFALKGDVSLAGMKLGYPNAAESKKFAVTSITIDTGAGSPPSFSASGEQVPDDSTHQDCYYDVPSATVKVCHHAQILWNAFTVTGSGCYLTNASYTAGCSLTKATKDGDTIAYDVMDGALTVNVTVVQTGNTKPTITAGSDWVVTSPATCSNPDADYPSWTATLTKTLEHHQTANG